MSRHVSVLAANSVSVSGSNLTWVVVVGVVALLALGVAGVLVREVLAASKGTQRMQEISLAVQEGAAAYLRRQFRTLGVFVVIIFFVLAVLPADGDAVRWGRSLFFLVGALFSGLTGFTGMSLCVRGNVRVAAAAKAASGPRCGSRSDRRRGRDVHRRPRPVRRRGGGADLPGERAERAGRLWLRRSAAGAVHACRRRHLHQGGRRRRDLVGKVEQGIPEDDPRNPATIADNVGDNVGDCTAWPRTCSSPTRSCWSPR